LWPLPGGAGSYLPSLATILELVARSESSDSAVKAIEAQFSQVSSLKACRSYLHVVANLGMIDIDGYHVAVTEMGSEYRRTKDPRLVRSALMDRIEGVKTILEILHERPRRIGLLHAELKQRGFVSWTTDKQVRYRLRWMEELGMVGKRGSARPEYFVDEL
jgi:hypothetical protein